MWYCALQVDYKVWAFVPISETQRVGLWSQECLDDGCSWQLLRKLLLPLFCLLLINFNEVGQLPTVHICTTAYNATLYVCEKVSVCVLMIITSIFPAVCHSLCLCEYCVQCLISWDSISSGLWELAGDWCAHVITSS